MLLASWEAALVLTTPRRSKRPTLEELPLLVLAAVAFAPLCGLLYSLLALAAAAAGWKALKVPLALLDSDVSKEEKLPFDRVPFCAQ